MPDLTIPVFAHARVTAWPHDEADPAAYMPVAKAFTVDFESDAHFQAINCPAIEFRLRKESVEHITDGVPLVLLVFDVDNHSVTNGDREPWWQDERVKLSLLLDKHPGGFVYRTRGGYRIVYTLTSPFTIRCEADGRRWRTFYHRCALYLARAFDIAADLACADWTRLFRLPHATRDLVSGPERHDTMGDPSSIAPFSHQPDASNLEDDLSTARARFETFATANPDAKRNPYAPLLRELEPDEPDTSVPVPCPQSYTGRETARARTALDRECESIATAPQGNRNHAINGAAYSLGRFVSAGEIDEGQVKARLLAAAQQCGSVKQYGKRQIEGVIEAGLKAGQKNRPGTPLKEGSHRPSHEPSRSIDSPEDLPPLWEGEEEPVDPPPEAAEEVSAGPTIAPLQRLIDLLTDKHVDARLVMPPGFRLTANPKGEVSLAIETKKQSRVKSCPECSEVCKASQAQCSQGHPLPDPAEEITQTPLAHQPVWIAAELVRPTTDGNLLALCALIDGRRRSLVVARGLIHDARKLAPMVEGAGFALVASKTSAFDLARYLSQFLRVNRHVLPRRKALSALGWDDTFKSFLLGHAAIGASDVVLHAPENRTLSRVASWLAPAGKSSTWLETISAFLVSCPTLGLVLAAAVASPMLRPFGWPTIGVLLSSLGGAGKTSILVGGASVFGNPGDPSSRQAAGIVGNGNATLMGLMGQFISMPDLPHMADELRVNVHDARSRSEVEGALHQLIDGQERARLRRDSKGTIGNRQSPGCAILATETDTSEFIRKGGASRRYLSVRGPYGEALGRFVPALCSNYAHAGRALIEALVASSPEQRDAMSSLRDRHASLLKAQLSASELMNESIRTWTEQIAVAMAASEVACSLCPDLFPDHEMWSQQILSSWSKVKSDPGAGGEHGDAPLAAYRCAVEWVASMRAHLLPLKGDPQRRVAEPVIGKVRSARFEDSDSEELEKVDLVQGRLTEYLQSKGYSVATLTTQWAARGWLQTGKRAGQHSISARIGGTPTECYRLVLPTEDD